MTAVAFTPKTGLAHLRKPVRLDLLTREEARVLIAKDVLAALVTRKIRAGGSYAPLFRYTSPSEQARESLPSAQCSVCAIGAAMTAYIARYNKITVGEIERDRSSASRTRLGRFFGQGELSRMEHLYEDWAFYSRNHPFPDCVVRHPARSNARMRVIFQHIVDKKGGPFTL